MKLLKLDLEGTLSENEITNEFHELERYNNKNDRILIPKHGDFFKDSLLIRNVDNLPLYEDIDYITVRLNPDLTEITGKDVRTFIIIINRNVSNTVKINYRAIGGNLTLEYDELKTALEETDHDIVEKEFKDIVGLPEGWKGDRKHSHKYWQLYGMETLIENLNKLEESIYKGTKSLINSVDEYIDHHLNSIETLMIWYRLYLNHLVDFTNSHELTKEQVQLEKINNWDLADKYSSINKTEDNLYTPISSLSQMFNEYLYPYLTAHVISRENPHEVTWQQLNTLDRNTIDNLYNERLLRSSNAYDTNKLEGKTLATFTTDVTTNFLTSDISANNVFDRRRVAPNPPDNTLRVLAGNNTFRTIQEMSSHRMDLYYTWRYLPGVTNATAAWNEIVSTPAPFGTILMKNYADGHSRVIICGVRNANGTTSRIF